MSPPSSLRLVVLTLLCGCQLFVDDDGEKEREDTAARCADKVDNDGDGAIDCQEQDCSGKAACPHVADIEWVEVAGGADHDVVNGIASDPQGNIILTGSVTGMARFGQESTRFAGASDIFVAKYDPKGGLVWVRRAGSDYSDAGTAVATDKEGNVYITGDTKSPLSFEESAMSENGPGEWDVFVAKYTASGKHVWHTIFGGIDIDQGTGIAVDDTGHAYVTGSFQDALPYEGCVERIADLAGDIFVMKLDPDGKTLWTRCYGQMGADAGYDITLNAEGNVVVTGTVASEFALVGDQIMGQSTGTLDVFVAVLDPKGTLLWGRIAGGQGEENAYRVAIDPKDGGIVLAGAMDNDVDFSVDDRPLLRPDTTVRCDDFGTRPDGFAVKYTRDGKTALWARRWGGSCDDAATGLSISRGGRVTVSGTFQGAATFGDVTTRGTTSALDPFVTQLNAQGSRRSDAFVTELDAETGNFLSAYGFGGVHDEGPAVIVHTGERSGYLTGSFRGDVSFGTTIGKNTDPCPSSIECTSDVFLMALTFY
jgi:hypothetical protein